MNKLSTRLGIGFWCVATGVTFVAACGDDASDAQGSLLLDAGTDSGSLPEQMSGEPVSFTVPPGGGEVALALPSGNEITFEFPASAAGQDITLTPATPSSIGWSNNELKDVVQMEPDGLQFDEPVIVRPESGDLIVLNFPTGSQRTEPEMLEFNAARDGLELNHFSYLALLGDMFCGGQLNRWNVTPNSPRCSGTDSSFIEFDCQTSVFCLDVEASCCAPSDYTMCDIWTDATLVVSASDPSGMYPYCAAASDQDSGMSVIPEQDAGPSPVDMETDSGLIPGQDSGLLPGQDSGLVPEMDSGIITELDGSVVVVDSGSGSLDSGSGGGGGGDAGVCMTGPVQSADFAVAHTCLQPKLINLGLVNFGIVVSVATSDLGPSGDIGTGVCPWNNNPADAGAHRDTVFNVAINYTNTTSVTISVDPVPGKNPRITIFDASDCSVGELQCSDSAGPGQCETTTVQKSQITDENFFVVISEDVSGPFTDYTVRFRADN